MWGFKQMTTRKCLAAQQNSCNECNNPCIACGTKKFTVNTDCELCKSCEKDRLSPSVLDRMKNAEVRREKHPLIIIAESGVSK